MPRKKLIVISAPSGSGKTTIAHEIMKLNPALGFSVSATTREKRNGEIDGKDYHFLTEEEFKRRADAGRFIEWEEVYPGKLYGTLKEDVEIQLRSDKNILFDVDVKGALAIKQQYPEACLIFVRPPSVDILHKRLAGRKTEDPEMIAQRLQRVPMELELGRQFDHQVVNDVLHKAVAEVQKIVEHHLQSQGETHAHQTGEH